MKIALVIIVALGLLWVGSIKYQEMTRVPVALKIIHQKMEDLKTEGFDKLVKEVGSGYIKEDQVINGVTYSLCYAVAKAGSFKDLRKVSEEQLKNALKPGENIRSIDILGYVNCMSIIPFGYFKMGPSFILTIEKE